MQQVTSHGLHPTNEEMLSQQLEMYLCELLGRTNITVKELPHRSAALGLYCYSLLMLCFPSMLCRVECMALYLFNSSFACSTYQ